MLSQTHSDFWQQALQVIKCTVLSRQQACTHTVLWAVACGRLSYPYHWNTEKQCKRQAHWPWTFHLHNTLPYPSSSPLGGPSNLHKAKPDQPLCSYYHTVSKSYQYLASQDITQVLHASTLHDPRFCVNPASVECCSLCTSCAMALFSCRLMPYSSSLLATGVLTQCSATYMSSPIQSCQDCPNSSWLVAITSS